MRRIAGRSDNCYATAGEVGHAPRQAIVLAAEPMVLDDHVLAIDVADVAEAFRERSRMASGATGIAGCCARAASGHAAAPPSAASSTVHGEGRSTTPTKSEYGIMSGALLGPRECPT
jgi:hypothetical protein